MRIFHIGGAAKLTVEVSNFEKPCTGKVVYENIEVVT